MPLKLRMIDYNEDWLFATVFRLDGSVALRSTLFALPAALCLGGRSGLANATLGEGWKD